MGQEKVEKTQRDCFKNNISIIFLSLFIFITNVQNKNIK